MIHERTQRFIYSLSLLSRGFASFRFGMTSNNVFCQSFVSEALMIISNTWLIVKTVLKKNLIDENSNKLAGDRFYWPSFNDNVFA